MTREKIKKQCQYLPSLPFVEDEQRVGEGTRQSLVAEAAIAEESAVGSASQADRRSVNITPKT